VSEKSSIQKSTRFQLLRKMHQFFPARELLLFVGIGSGNLLSIPLYQSEDDYPNR
jgi:hypothetical protein